MSLDPLPRIPAYALDREFYIDQVNEEVTSIDLAPHGGFCILSCSNGAVVLFDLTSTTSQRNGYLIALIRPKGMHTSLRVTVKISDDSRFCFVGVRKGSSDMLAIDLTNYPVDWSIFPSYSTFLKTKRPASIMNEPSNLQLPPFEVYSHNDPKLRGFGTATSVANTLPIEGTQRFWLACGMGIKNVHVWQLLLSPLSPTDPGAKRDSWQCIFDVATNGSSISHLGFRKQGLELLSKCVNGNVRLWDLSVYDQEESNTTNASNNSNSSNNTTSSVNSAAISNLKPSYEDIANSTDVKAFLEHSVFTFGGAYEFSVLKIDKQTPKEANRNVFELPDKTPLASLEERRRRATREIEEVVGTSDGMHAVIVCADGLAMHYYRSSLSSSSSSCSAAEQNDETDLGKLEELDGFLDMERRDQFWTLKRAGAEGHVVLLRAMRGSQGECVLKVSRLAERVKDRKVFGETAGVWQGMYACVLPREVMEKVGESEGDGGAGAGRGMAGVEKVKLPPRPSSDKKRKTLGNETPTKRETPSHPSLKAAPPIFTPSPQVIARKAPRLTPPCTSERLAYRGGEGIAMQSPMPMPSPPEEVEGYWPLVIPPVQMPPKKQIKVSFKECPPVTLSPVLISLISHLTSLLSSYTSSLYLPSSPLSLLRTLSTTSPFEGLGRYTEEQGKYSLLSLLSSCLYLEREVGSVVGEAVQRLSEGGGLGKVRGLGEEMERRVERAGRVVREESLPRLRAELRGARGRDEIYLLGEEAGERKRERERRVESLLGEGAGCYEGVVKLTLTFCEELKRYLREEVEREEKEKMGELQERGETGVRQEGEAMRRETMAN